VPGGCVRLFLHDEIYAEFLAKLTDAFRHIRVGSPLDPAMRRGCLVSEKQGECVMKYDEIGKTEANLVIGGQRLEVPGREAGWFVAPTIFETANDARIAQEEIFGRCCR
jgi:aldehyde dehydrogenase (NAD+)